MLVHKFSDLPDHPLISPSLGWYKVRHPVQAQGLLVEVGRLVRRQRKEMKDQRMGKWEYHGNIWEYMGIYGDIWEYMGIYGNIREYMGIYGDIWEYMGVWWGYDGDITNQRHPFWLGFVWKLGIKPPISAARFSSGKWCCQTHVGFNMIRVLGNDMGENKVLVWKFEGGNP